MASSQAAAARRPAAAGVILDRRPRAPGTKRLQLRVERLRFHLQTLMIYKLGFYENYYTSTSILLITIVLCSKFL